MTRGSKTKVTEKVNIKFQPSSTTFTHTKMHLIRILISPSDILWIYSEYPVYDTNRISIEYPRIDYGCPRNIGFYAL